MKGMMPGHEKSPSPPPPPWSEVFPSPRSIPQWSKCFYTDLVQSIVVEGPASADADQHYREAVDVSKLSFAWRAFSEYLVSFLQCKAAETSDHSLLHFSSFKRCRNSFILCDLSSSRQRPMWKHDNENEILLFSYFMNKYLLDFFLNMTWTLHYGFCCELDTRHPWPFVAKSPPVSFYVMDEMVCVDSNKEMYRFLASSHSVAMSS